uniref:Uncharacterized protein n=1 Tax=Oryza meridionalis TaxID=40149 RepID=A0A0E0D5T6_9ORYZ
MAGRKGWSTTFMAYSRKDGEPPCSPSGDVPGADATGEGEVPRAERCSGDADGLPGEVSAAWCGRVREQVGVAVSSEKMKELQATPPVLLLLLRTDA